MAITAEQRKQKLRERQQYATKHREERVGSIDLIDMTKIPGTNIFKMKKGRGNMIDILPWVVTQGWYAGMKTYQGSPTGLEVGYTDYKMEIPAHRSVGMDERWVVCRRLAFGQACPICQDRQVEFDKDEADQSKELIKALRPSWRDVYCVWDHNDPEGGIKIWEVSYHLFEKFLLNEIAEQSDAEDWITVSDCDDGRIIQFRGREKQLGQSTFIEAEGIELVERDGGYVEGEILEMTYPLDSLLVLPSYEEVSALYLGLDSPEEGGGGGEHPAPSTKPSPSPKKGPGPRRGTPVSKPQEDGPEWGGDEPPDTGEWECPVGGEFGVDCQAYEECAECEIFEDCAAMQEELDQQAAASKRSTAPTPKGKKGPTPKKKGPAPKGKGSGPKKKGPTPRKRG